MKRRKVKRKTREELEREQREGDAQHGDWHKWDQGFDGQRYVPKLED